MTGKFKILYLIERLTRAGTELHLVKLLEHLDRSRYEPVLCCLNEEMTDADLVPADVPAHMLGAGWNLLRPSTLGVYRRLEKLLAREKPDLLHSFLFVSNVMGPFAARRKGIRLVIASRGRMGIEWEAHFLHKIFQKAADRRTDVIICKTQAMKNEIHLVENTPLDKIHVIPNGVDMNEFAIEPGKIRHYREKLARDRGVSPEGPLLIAIGNLKPIKSHGTLIEAAAQIVGRFPYLQVAIVGKGEDESSLREAVARHGLEKNVHLTGDVDDVRPWMGAADLFVAASLSEGMPNAVLEAMALGLPLVLSEIPGHSEIARSDAWYFAPGDAQGLAGALADAIASPDKRAARGRAGTERIKSEFSLDAMVQRIERLYEKLLTP